MWVCLLSWSSLLKDPPCFSHHAFKSDSLPGSNLYGMSEIVCGSDCFWHCNSLTCIQIGFTSGSNLHCMAGKKVYSLSGTLLLLLLSLHFLNHFLSSENFYVFLHPYIHL